MPEKTYLIKMPGCNYREELNKGAITEELFDAFLRRPYRQPVIPPSMPIGWSMYWRLCDEVKKRLQRSSVFPHHTQPDFTECL